MSHALCSLESATTLVAAQSFAVAPSAVAPSASAPADAIASVRQGTLQMRGVTLAGWLVLEQALVPSLWAGVGGGPVGEYALMQAAAAQVRVCCRVTLTPDAVLRRWPSIS